MIDKINEKINAINELLVWIKENKPDLYEQRFVPLVQERCRLRTVREAKKENPAIAAYGESQKGKSYLMGNLLQKDGKPFTISLPSGEKINFVRSINPIGKMREATGVVTRFTAFKGTNKGRYSEKYPVLMKLLSVSDMATILCDSYYNDLRDPGHFTDQEIKERGDALYEKYKNSPEQNNPHLVADDIIDIKNYVIQNMRRSANSLVNGANSSIFDKIAMIISRVPQQDWSQVLGFLWHDNKVFIQLFERLLGAMRKLEFSYEVYLPVDAVRHYGVNENTIMSVACLNGLDKPDFNKKTDVFIREGENYKRIADFNKAELCAICAETAYRVDDDFLNTKASYCLDMLPEETKAKLLSTTVDKDVLNVADLLDFPGARNRESIAEAKLSDYDEKEGASNTVKSLLRGKVAYLFNKYCSSRAINILMFCHDHMNYNVTNLPFVIENWVDKYVGKTPEKRSETVGKSEGISPLFIIATKFNIDMTLDQDNINSESNSRAAVDGRWNGRFQEVLYRDILQAHSVEWFNNWIKEGETFKNTYLLRDYKYSTCSGDGSNLYEGYVEDDDNPREKKMHLLQDFYVRLRTSFNESDIVKKFFEDPLKSWDLAATINNDGALYIIDRLRIVAKNMVDIRNDQFKAEVEECLDNVRKMMENDYEPEGDEENQKKDIQTAKKIMAELDASSQCDMYFFGHLIQTLQIDSTLTYNLVKDYIDNGDPAKGPIERPYEIISRQCGDFEGIDDPNEMMKVFMGVYGFDSVSEAEDYLVRNHIKKSILFGKKKAKLSSAAIVANIIYQAWIKQLRSNELLNKLLINEDQTKVTIFTQLLSRLIDSSEQLGLCEKMGKEIEKYLNIVNIHTAKADLVSDILSHLINSFVVDLGYSLRKDEQIEASKMLAKQYNIPLFKYIGKGIEPIPEEETISDLFTKMMEKGNSMTRTFEQNYFEWKEYMFLAFLSGAAHIIKNPEANKALGEMLKKLKY